MNNQSFYQIQMEHKGLWSLLFGAKRIRDGQKYYAIRHRLVYHCSSEGDDQPPEWYERAFRKMKKWSHSLNALDLISGRLVNISDHSRVLDDKLEQKMHSFKSVSRVFIGLPTIQEATRKNMMASLANSTHFANIQWFSKKHERVALCINSLTKVSDILGISAQQRKVVRQTICPQVTRHQIWTGALMEILNELKSEIEVLIDRRPTKEMIFGQQIVACCLKLLKSSTCYDPEVTSWMRPKPLKGAESTTDPPKWQDVLDMSTDLVNCLCNEKELAHHVTKIEIMKEGLYQIRDVLIDRNIRYAETRYQEHLVNKKLTKSLGFSSQCLFTLLVYYLYGSVGEIEVEVRGGLQRLGGGGGGEFWLLYMGKLLTLDEDKVVWNGVRQLDKALGLFKFVWETAGMKGDLELQGHLWSFGAEDRSLNYRGNVYLLHGINFEGKLM